MAGTVTIDGFTFQIQVGGLGALIEDDGRMEWSLSTLEGWWDGVDARDVSADRAWAHGQSSGPNFKGPRIISVVGDLTATDESGATLRAAQERLSAICADPHQLYEFVVADDERGTTSAMVKVSGAPKHTSRGGLQWGGIFSATFKAPDPRRYGPWITAESSLPDGGTGGVESDPGGVLSDPLGVEAGTPATGGTATLLIEGGTAPTAPVLEILGPAITPAMFCPEVGCLITYYDTLLAGQRAFINLGDVVQMGVPPYEVTVDGQPQGDRLAIVGPWPELMPGVTTWLFSSGAYDADARLFVHGRSGYL